MAWHGMDGGMGMHGHDDASFAENSARIVDLFDLTLFINLNLYTNLKSIHATMHNYQDVYSSRGC